MVGARLSHAGEAVIARSACDEAIQSACVSLDCFACARNDVEGLTKAREFVIARSPCDEAIVCGGKAQFLRGCKSLPARVAPAGSNRSRREGNDPSEAFDGKGR